MKRILILTIAVFLFCDLQAQSFRKLKDVNDYVVDSIKKRPDKITANTLNKALQGITAFTPDIVQDTATVVTPLHGWIRFQRKDSTAYIYDTISFKRWRKYVPASAGGGGGAIDQNRIAPSAVANTFNPTLAEIKKDITNNHGDSAKLYQYKPSAIQPIQRKELFPDLYKYKALPGLMVSPITRTFVEIHTDANGHAVNVNAAWTRSTDHGKTWSSEQHFYPNPPGSWTYPAASGCDPNGVFWAIIHEQHNSLLAYLWKSVDDGKTFSVVDTLDFSSIFSTEAYPETYNLFFQGSNVFMLVYGLDAAGSDFKLYSLKSSDMFATWTTSLVDNSANKINEAAYYQVGDSIFIMGRAEATTGAKFWRFNSTNGLTATTWGNKTAITFDTTVQPTMPNPTVLQDGSIFCTLRLNTANQNGAFFLSPDNGLSYKYAGLLDERSTAPLMYSAQHVENNTIYQIYSLEPDGNTPFSGNRAGISMQTLPVNNSSYWIKTPNLTAQIFAPQNPASLSPVLKAVDATPNYMYGAQERPLTLRLPRDSVPNARLALKVGEDIEHANGSNAFYGIPSSGLRSGTFNISSHGGPVTYIDTIARVDSIPVTGAFTVGTANDRYVFFFGPVAQYLRFNMYNRTKTYFTGDAFDVTSGAWPFGDKVYAASGNTDVLREIDRESLATTTYTMPSTGWDGGWNQTRTVAFASKRTDGNQLLAFNPRTKAFTTITTPHNGSWSVGPSDDTYQYFVGYGVSYWLQVNIETFEIKELKYNNPGFFFGIRTGGIFVGSEIWTYSALSRSIDIYNPYTDRSESLELPIGTGIVKLVFDGTGVSAIAATGDNYRINPRTRSYHKISLSDGGISADKWADALMYNNYMITVPNTAGDLDIVEFVEYNKNNLNSLYDQIEKDFGNFLHGTGADNRLPVWSGDTLTYDNDLIVAPGRFHSAKDSFGVGSVPARNLKIIVVPAATSYANDDGSGDRTLTITATTNLTFGGGNLNNLINGNTTTNNTFFTNLQAVAGKYIQFEFSTEKRIDEAKWYQQTTDTHGVWKWQGSHDGIVWFDIGSSFTYGGATTQTMTTLSANNSRYKYYRMFGISGTTSSAPWIYEFEFKISDDGTNDKVKAQTYLGNIPGGIFPLQPDGGHVTAPTESSSDSSTYVATTAFVKQSLAGFTGTGDGSGASYLENGGTGDSVLMQLNDSTLLFKSDSLYSSDGSVTITKHHDSENRRYDFSATVRTINSQYTDVGNVGTGEDDLMSYTVPANTLAADGDRLEIDANYTFAANANSKTIKFKFASALSLDYGSSVTSSGGGLNVHLTLIRTGASTQKAIIVFRPTHGTFDASTTTCTLTMSSSFVFKTTATATADNDIVQNSLTVTYYKAL
jgi:hypothetical protein